MSKKASKISSVSYLLQATYIIYSYYRFEFCIKKVYNLYGI